MEKAEAESADMCLTCGGTACDQDAHGDEFLRDTYYMYDAEPEQHTDLENKTVRHSAYRLFTQLKYVHLSKGR